MERVCVSGHRPVYISFMVINGLLNHFTDNTTTEWEAHQWTVMKHTSRNNADNWKKIYAADVARPIEIASTYNHLTPVRHPICGDCTRCNNNNNNSNNKTFQQLKRPSTLRIKRTRKIVSAKNSNNWQLSKPTKLIWKMPFGERYLKRGQNFDELSLNLTTSETIFTMQFFEWKICINDGFAHSRLD